MNRRKPIASIAMAILIGSITLTITMSRPRLDVMHGADIISLLAAGMCYGVALMGLIMMFRKPRT